jgi:DNA-binding transcriptional ArsR family regulator
MVVGQIDPHRVDQMFHALADATRRDIVLRVLQGEWSVSALARNYPMSFAAVQKHVAVLERAAVVTKVRRGREQIVRANIAAVRDASSVLDHFESVWRSRMDRFAELLAEQPDAQLNDVQVNDVHVNDVEGASR